MIKDIKKHVKEYDTCLRQKVESLAPMGHLQPLSIPKQPWVYISMDFIEGLPKSHHFDVIFVVVDRLTKYAHFIPLSHPYIAAKVASLFLQHVIKLHGIPKSIVNHRDPTFTGHFWAELFKL